MAVRSTASVVELIWITYANDTDAKLWGRTRQHSANDTDAKLGDELGSTPDGQWRPMGKDGFLGFKLEEDEFVTGIVGSQGEVLTNIQFKTSKGRETEAFGGSCKEGEASFEFTKTDSSGVSGVRRTDDYTAAPVVGIVDSYDRSVQDTTFTAGDHEHCRIPLLLLRAGYQSVQDTTFTAGDHEHSKYSRDLTWAHYKLTESGKERMTGTFKRVGDAELDLHATVSSRKRSQDQGLRGL